MKPSVHLVTSVVVSTSLYVGTHSVLLAGTSFICGFMIDADHFIEYFREYGVRMHMHEFFRVFHETRFTRLFLIFHAWEWVAALLIASWLTGWNGIVSGVLVGVTHHLMLDQLGNGIRPWGYFISYRATHRFSMEKIMVGAVVNQRRGAGGAVQGGFRRPPDRVEAGNSPAGDAVEK